MFRVALLPVIIEKIQLENKVNKIFIILHKEPSISKKNIEDSLCKNNVVFEIKLISLRIIKYFFVLGYIVLIYQNRPRDLWSKCFFLQCLLDLII